MSEALTPDQVRILTMICDGATSEEMGRALRLKTPTLKRRLEKIFERLNARNRPHAAALAVRLGIVE